MGHVALPHWLARLNLRFSSAFMRPIAARLPWFGVIEHIGRTSGTVRRTALMAFHRRPDHWVIALTYGTDAQWLKKRGCRGWRAAAEPRQVGRRSGAAAVP